MEDIFKKDNGIKEYIDFIKCFKNRIVVIYNIQQKSE